MVSVLMPEKREGQDIIRVFVATGLKERFKLWCQLQGISMTQVIEGWIEEALENEDFGKLVQERLKQGK
jgi:hypothetical protein